MARKFIPRRNYAVTVFVNNDEYSDCNCTTMNSVKNFIDRQIESILMGSKDLSIFPEVVIQIQDYHSLL